MVNIFSVSKRVSMSNLKICTLCNKTKEADIDFYLCGGKYRSECKTCTIRKNVAYQRRVKSWKYRYGSEEERKLYMRTYYHKNKNKFAKYREEFRDKYPGYYKEYFRTRKEKEDRQGEVPI